METYQLDEIVTINDEKVVRTKSVSFVTGNVIAEHYKTLEGQPLMWGDNNELVKEA